MTTPDPVKRYGGTEYAEKFAHIENRFSVNADGCWIWNGCVSADGYGQMRFRGKTVYVHRFICEHFHGPISAGLCVDHLCRVRRCGNPNHLEATTISTNNFRGEQSLRTTCPKGHAYTSENTRRDKDGHKRCRACGDARFRWAYSKRLARAAFAALTEQPNKTAHTEKESGR